MRIIIFAIAIILFSSSAYCYDKRWLGKTNNRGHITNSKQYRKSTIPRYHYKPKFNPYSNTYWTVTNPNGKSKKYNLGKFTGK